MQGESKACPSVFDHLTPGEFAAVAALLEGGVLTSVEYPQDSDVTEYLSELTHTDPQKAVEMHRALADSPLIDARVAGARTLPELSGANHDGGFELLLRLMGDPSKRVRNTAEYQLNMFICDASSGDSPGTGFYAIGNLDEDWLAERTGLTRQDTYDLYLSYAYAENGVCFDLGWAALAKINEASIAVEQ